MRGTSTAMSSGCKIMMILSPAKTLNLHPLQPSKRTLPSTEPDCDIEKTSKVAMAMKDRKQGELEKLLGVSSAIAKTAFGYWEDYSTEIDSRTKDETVKPCIYSFSGAAYQGLQIQDCNEDAVLYLQESLRIIDPLYGVLRPLDKMQPYRLEMATRGVFKDDKSIKLAKFWSLAVTRRLSDELSSGDDSILLNLASDEYSAAVDKETLPSTVRYIKAVFQVEGRVVAVHAKRARGLMARFLANRKACHLEDIKEFNLEGYSFQASKSDDTTLVFNRSNKTIANNERKRPKPAEKTSGNRSTKRVK